MAVIKDLKPAEAAPDETIFNINCELYWASLSTPNEMSGKFQVDLCNLSESAIQNFTRAGVQVRNKEDDRGFFVTGKSNFPIVAIYDGEPLPEKYKIGHGSKALVTVNTFAWSFKGKSGVSVGIKRLIITDIVMYGSDGNIDFDTLETF